MKARLAGLGVEALRSLGIGRRTLEKEELREHVFGTYITLRLGMAGLAFAFPILLYAVGRIWYGIGLEDSMSHYYFALSPDDVTARAFPMRKWFVGILFAVGACLVLYRGLSDLENGALNFAGLFAMMVALIPMNWECGQSCPPVNWHGISAVLLFVALAVVCFFCQKESLKYLDDPRLRERYRLRYKVIGVAMVAVPVIAFLITVFMQDLKKYVFFVESVAVWVFAWYWWVKTGELRKSCADLRILAPTATLGKQ